MALTESDQVASELSRGAFFFAMRSCEYLKVSGTERRTKLLTIVNIRLYRDRQEMPHDHPELHLADCVNITFYYQKMTNEMLLLPSIAPTTHCFAQFAAGRTLSAASCPIPGQASPPL
eukprot:scaffold133943_cov30-Attheya_sp.AAC.1